METRYAVLARLADGRFYSGEALAEELGVSRAAIWKGVDGLRQLGLSIDAVRGRGYRLSRPLDLLDAAEIRAAMAPAAAARLAWLEVRSQIDSTNLFLMKSTELPDVGYAACLAESQSHGRGRRGRRWASPFGANLYLSLGCMLDAGPLGLDGLSLAVGIGVARALERAGAGEVAVKWPNDLLWRGRKLGGVLIELSSQTDGRGRLVVGVGLNVDMPEAAGAAIDQPWCDLSEVLARRFVERNRLAALVLDELLAVLDAFFADGLAPFLTQWAHYDCLNGRVVRLQRPGQVVEGVARGIDSAGALLVEVAGELQRITSGEVSVRADP